GADAGHRLRSEHGRSQGAKLVVEQFGAGMDGQWSIILSEHIWPFVHGFCFRSRSVKWCAIEPRGEGLGGGVRSQGGQKRSEDFLERSGRRTPPPYNRPRSHRASAATVKFRLGD